MIGITKQISEKLLRAEAGGTTTRTKAAKHGIRDRPQGTIEQPSPIPGHLVHDTLQKWYFSLTGTEDCTGSQQPCSAMARRGLGVLWGESMGEHWRCHPWGLLCTFCLCPSKMRQPANTEEFTSNSWIFFFFKGSMPSVLSNTGLELMTLRAEIKGWTFNQPSHPGAQVSAGFLKLNVKDNNFCFHEFFFFF